MTVRKTTRGGEPRWVIDIIYVTAAGEKSRFRRDAQVQTATAARAEEQRLVRQLALTGELPTTDSKPADATFADAVSIYRKHVAATKKPSTRRGYEEILKKILEPTLASTLLRKISAGTVEEIDGALAQKGLSTSRRRNVQVVLRTVLRVAATHGLLSDSIKLPRLLAVGRTVQEIPTEAELKAILSSAQPAMRLAFALAAFAGLRSGEVRGLRWADVDLAGGIVTVRRSVSHGIEAPPKSGHQRRIPIAAPLRLLLEEAGQGAAIQLVAPNTAGQPWPETGLYPALVRACVRAGVKQYTFHSLRHYFVTRLFGGGTPAPAVQALAGHGSLTVTQRYAHVTSGDLSRAVANCFT